MGNMTLALPDELQKRMRKHSEIRWSEVVRKTIEERIEILERMDELLKNSKLTQKDVDFISAKIKKEIADDFLNGRRR